MNTESSQQVMPSEALLVVVIGSSAGGIKVLNQFFDVMPSDADIAFVIISHLDPHRPSYLTELIQKHTEMHTLQISDATRIEKNKIYIIPPNNLVSISNGILHLQELQPGKRILPFDYFLNSLANDATLRHACIVLSGNACDGSSGIAAIKANNSLVLVQDPSLAEHPSMPKSAIETGHVDYILAVECMPEYILSYRDDELQLVSSQIKVEVDTLMDDQIQEVIDAVCRVTSHDFSDYKKSSIGRRICKRMQMYQFETIEDYLKYLRNETKEAKQLFKDLLIGVTSFFRDPDAFEVLAQEIKVLMKSKPLNYEFRIWVPGCSHGEEAYSLAILFRECMEVDQRFKIKIFATDTDKAAIRKARIGMFSLASVQGISEDRLRRFFTKEDKTYRVCSFIREMIIFAPHNIIDDPVYTTIDLISCRNLLIYFTNELQNRLFPHFSYSLKPAGLLFLGLSESVGTASVYFQVISQKWKIYKKTTASAAIYNPTELAKISQVNEQPKDFKLSMSPQLQMSDDALMFQIIEFLLKWSKTPPALVVDGNDNLVYVHGDVAHVFKPVQGKMSSNILNMVRSDIREEFSDCLFYSRGNNNKTTTLNIQYSADDGTPLTLVFIPIQCQGELKDYRLIMFREVFRRKNDTAKNLLAASRPDKKKAATKAELEAELQETQHLLQTTVDDLESFNEELKLSNDELQIRIEQSQSTLEELQSNNEELQSSKEELQSLNEESTTVNTELQSRVDELTHASDDMNNLLDSVQLATIFLNTQAEIRRFTPNILPLIPITLADVGRPIGNFSTSFKQLNLTQLVMRVLDDLKTHAIETNATDDRIFKVRAKPYRTARNIIDGAVVTFEDITGNQQIRMDYNRQSSILAGVMETIDQLILVIDSSGAIICFNNHCQNVTGYTLEEVVGRHYSEFLLSGTIEKNNFNAYFNRYFDKNSSANKSSANTLKNLKTVAGVWRCKDGSHSTVNLKYNILPAHQDAQFGVMILTGLSSSN